MIDTTPPSTSVEVSSFGKITFKCIDSELLPFIGGVYEAVSNDSKEYYFVIEHQRGGLSFTGWAIQKKDYKQELNTRDELRMFSGEINFENSNIFGRCQRFSGRGMMIDDSPFVGEFGKNVHLVFADKLSLDGKQTMEAQVQLPLFFRGK